MRDPFASSDEDEIPTAEALFHEVLSLPRDAWAAHLERACPPDRQPALHAEVMALLQGHEQAGGFLPFESDATRLFRRPAAPLPEKPGDLIGPYKLKEQIGEGGFGVVWVADQEQPVRRRVALKILKPGMDTKQVMARFEQERQALAMMDHPNIARVLDAGATPLGRPFFVMELVKGVKITQYCDQAHLPTRDRLRLFIAVCQAVQHAHQKGVIHRDLKPSNILVTLHDGVPVPKVIDFGVAKATQQQHLTDLTIYTQFEQMLGTPLYMSPEQAELSGLDIDTRSDIYSLGVLLYELLTGRTPFDPESLMKRGLEEIRRAVREQEPQKPSTFISTLALDRRTDLARQRQTDSARLLGQIRGDLDWIVMKALEKDRSRRYETATGLAQDIQRHLDSEPVQARPPTMGYRFRRFARRHKTTFAAAATVLAALVTGLATTTWMFFKEKDARERAVAAEEEQGRLRQLAVDAERAQTQQREKAEAAAAKSDQIALFLTDMLKGVGPSVAMGRDTTMLREILDKTAERLGTDLKDQPEIEGFLRFQLGALYRQMGDGEKAESMLREALTILEQLKGQENVDFAAVLVELAFVLASKGNLNEAEAMGREALEIRTKQYRNEHHLLIGPLNDLAFTLASKGNLEEAESLHRKALATAKKLLGNEHREVAASLEGLANVLSDQGNLADAETAYREVLAMEEKRPNDDAPGLAITLNNLAIVLHDRGKNQEAAPLLRRALAMQLKLLGPHHPDTATSLNNLALVLHHQKETDEAETMFREALAMRRTIFGTEHPSLATSLSNLASFLQDLGRLPEAEAMYRDALTIRKKLLGGNHPDLAKTLSKLATTLFIQDRLDEAEPLFREALEIYRKTLGSEHPDLGLTLNNLAGLLAKKKLYAAAEPLLREALAIQRHLVKQGHSELSLAKPLHNLAVTLTNQGQCDEAAPLAREALAIRKKLLGQDHPDIVESLLQLAATLHHQGNAIEAEMVYREALGLQRKNLGHDHPDIADTLHRLAHALEKKGDPKGADSMHREALELLRKSAGAEDLSVAHMAACFTKILLAAKEYADAEPLARESLAIREKKMPDDWRTFSSRSLLGGSLLGQQKLSAAGPLLLSGFEGMKQRKDKIPPAGRSNLQDALERLVQYFEAAKKPAQATAWQRELDASRQSETQPESGAKDNLQPR